jgi:hypothetical protein
VAAAKAAGLIGAPELQVMSCKEYRQLKGNEWAVACNQNTADGYYWQVDKWAAPYGYFSLVPVDGYPSCRSIADIDTVGNTAAWKETSAAEGFWVVARDYCRPFDPTEGKGQCTANYQSDRLIPPADREGPAHSGKYRAVCKRIPTL